MEQTSCPGVYTVVFLKYPQLLIIVEMIGRKDRLVASALGTAGSKIGETYEEQGWIS